MGRIVAIGGGDLSSTDKINRYAIEMSLSQKPRVLFIGTASQDADVYTNRFHEVFEGLKCEVKDLALTKNEYTEAEIDELLAWARIIYVGGGDTRSMMAVWKEHGVDAKLKEIYDKDRAVLMGISAGAICWFNCGHSDCEAFSGKEDWEYIFVEGMLDIYHYALCPHYNEEGRESFDAMVADKGMVGLALENNTALVEINGEYLFIRSDEERNAYWIKNVDGRIEKSAVEFLTKSYLEGRKIPSRDHGNNWDPKSYEMNFIYKAHWRWVEDLRLSDIPGAVRSATTAIVFGILGILIPVYVFSLISFNIQKKFRKKTSRRFTAMTVAKRLAAIGAVISVLGFPLVFVLILRLVFSLFPQ